MTADVGTGLKVEDALDAGEYRVFPETPLTEVLDLMVRNGLRAVPVVGDASEVLGILTAGEALGHVLRAGSGEEAEEPSGEGTLVRDHMTRSVLCVSVDQPLFEAANMLVNRGVDQLPVVREGAFVGFVTADSILAAYGRRPAPPESPEENG